jgi:hypothetical protein
MFSNFRYPVVLFILSFAGLMIGMGFKIMHWPGGQLISGSMIMVQVIAIAWLAIIALRSRK